MRTYTGQQLGREGAAGADVVKAMVTLAMKDDAPLFLRWERGEMAIESSAHHPLTRLIVRPTGPKTFRLEPLHMEGCASAHYCACAVIGAFAAELEREGDEFEVSPELTEKQPA